MILLFTSMIRYVKYLLAVVLLSGLTIGAKAQDDPKKKESLMRTCLLLNAGISDHKQPSLGFTVARIGPFGYYANLMIGIDNIHISYDHRIASDGSLKDGENAGLIPFYADRRANNRLSATIGAMAQMKIPLYTYLGAGYGYKSETWQMLNKQWVETAGSLRHSAVVEAGLIGRIDNITLSAGYMLFIGHQNRLYHEAKVGVGYTFDK